MSISFNEISSTSRIGGVKVEYDASGVGGGAQPHRVLLVCPKLSTGTLSTSRPKLLSQASQADALCGRGSIGARMIRAAYAQSSKPEYWAIGVADDVSDVAATGSIEVTAGPTKAGSIPLYIGGDRVAVSVAKDDTATQVATKIAAAVNAETALPVTASNLVAEVATATVTLTCRHKSALGNALSLQVACGATDALPAGLALTLTAMADGSGEIDAGDIIATILDAQFDTYVFPTLDPAELADWSTELERRFNAEIDMGGVLFAALTGDHSAMLTAGATLNSPHIVVCGVGTSPTPPWIWATALACLDAAEDDPGRTRKTLKLVGVKAPTAPWTPAEREQLLASGIATTYGDVSGAVYVERLITTFQRGADGAPSRAWMDVTKTRLALAIRRKIQERLRTRFPRHKLGSDASTYRPGQAIVQPKVVRDTIVELLGEMESDLGWIENAKETATGLVIERNASDPDRVDVLVNLDPINNLLTVAVRAGFGS